MRAQVITGCGGPEVLEMRDIPVPAPAPREVLIRVTAAGVNRADLLLQGQHAPVPKGWSSVPGLEVSGEIQAIGSGVKCFAAGDHVMALSLGGGYAEYCAVDERLVTTWPDSLSAEQAAGLPEAVATVWTSLVDRGRPKKGDRVLINGGASTIGMLAIAIAVRMGCHVAATAGSEEKCASAIGAGAHAAVNYRDDTVIEQLRMASDGNGFDVILDVAGGETLSRNVELLASRGRLVLIGMMAGRKGVLDLLPLMAKRGSVLGSTLFFRTLPDKGRALARGWACAADLMSPPGRLPLHVDRVFPLDQAADAQRRLDAADHRGKIVLRI